MDVTLPSGKIIKGVPDGTPKDVIMQKAIAAGMATEADFSQASQQQPNSSIGAVTGRDYSKPVQSDPSFMDKVGSVFTGNLRRTPEMEGLPYLGQEGSIPQIMGDMPRGDQIKFAALNIMTFSPEEIAKIAKSMNPDISVIYNKDAKGEVYPMLTNQKTGRTMLVNDPSLDIGDIGKFAGVGTSFTPAGFFTKTAGKEAAKAGIKSGVAQGAIKAAAAGTAGAGTQAIIEGGQALGGGDFDTNEIKMAAATGAGGEVVGSLLGSAYRYTKQLLGGQGDEQALKLVAQAEKAGIPLMTTDVYQPETALQKTYQLLSERIPFIGTGKMRADQMKARVDAVENLMADFAADTSEDYAPKIIESLKKANIEKMAKASAMRNSSESVLSTAGDVAPTKASAMISSELERESAKQLPDNGIIAYLETLKESLLPANFSTIRETRSALQGKVAEMYKGQNTQIGSSGAPTFTRIVGALNDDLTDFARSSGNKEAYRDWRLGNQLFRDEYIKLKGGALKNILDKGAIVPEVIRNALQESRPSQAIRLFANLTADGKANAKKMLLQDAYKKATSNATGEFSADTFATELSKKDQLFKVFFHGDDRQAVDGLTKVLQSTKRASQESALTNTGMQAGVLGGIGTGGYYAGVAPVTTLTTLLISGFGSQFLESKPMRNILIKLANTPEKSEAYGKLVTKLTQLAQPLINEDK